MPALIGLDIGGANLKAAHSTGPAQSIPFAMWKDPNSLGQHLRTLLQLLPACDGYALTMTGELCDCFVDQAAGVRFILNGVAEVLSPLPWVVWTLEGRFVSLDEALAQPHLVAAANWLAQATLAARLVPRQTALLLDMGSTTTDIVPLADGVPVPRGLADPERLAHGELVYAGARRTPVCAVLGPEVAAELFATMMDVYLVLGELPPQPDHRDTADGRPATVACAHARLARLLCADPSRCSVAVTTALAERARDRQVGFVRQAIANVAASLPRPSQAFLVSGSGAFVLRQLTSESDGWLSLEEKWGRERAVCACAWAVASLARETWR